MIDIYETLTYLYNAVEWAGTIPPRSSPHSAFTNSIFSKYPAALGERMK
jgi:hypothetical protein